MSEAPHSETSSNTPARRRGFGWWSGLVLCLGMAVGAGIYGLHVWQQRAFTEDIQAMGGTVVHAPIGPAWLTDAMPDFYHRSITYISAVRLKGAVIEDDLLDKIADRPGLRFVHLHGCKVTQPQIERLRSASPGLTVEVTGDFVSPVGY